MELTDQVATPQIPVPSPQRDGWLLHFLKELPGIVWVVTLLVFFTVIYLNFRDDFIPRLIDALIGAFLGLVVSQRPQRQQQLPPINTDSIGPVDINVTSEKKGDL